MSAIELVMLHDGAQRAAATVDRLVEFISAARRSLQIALYDAHFRDPAFADRIVAAIDEAEERGVDVRAVYNDDDGPGPYPLEERPRRRSSAEPNTGPSFLRRLHRAVPSRGVDGRFDLMHHKYVVRDGVSVWTGSSNWTDDSWARMENVLLVLHSAELASAYERDFEQLWRDEAIGGADPSKGSRRRSGALDADGHPGDRPAVLGYRGQPARVRALFSPRQGAEMSQLIASRIGEARRRVRICSPVVTSAPILGTLTEVVEDGRVDTLVSWDGPQMNDVLEQWRHDGRSPWKAPLVRQLQRSGRVAAKKSTPFNRDANTIRNFMHAKLVVCDDWVLTGSFNCSHSGERNAENVLEIRSAPLANELAAYAEQVHERYRAQSRPGTVEQTKAK